MVGEPRSHGEVFATWHLQLVETRIASEFLSVEAHLKSQFRDLSPYRSKFGYRGMSYIRRISQDSPHSFSGENLLASRSGGALADFPCWIAKRGHSIKTFDNSGNPEIWIAALTHWNLATLKTLAPSTVEIPQSKSLLVIKILKVETAPWNRNLWVRRFAIETPGYAWWRFLILYRWKFRSQTSDNMDRWKSRGGKSQRGEEQKR